MNDHSSQSFQTPPVSYGPLAQDLGYLIRRAQLWIFQDFIRQLAPVNLRPAQYSVLLIVAHNPGLAQIALASSLGIERARLVRLLDQLEERHLLERRPSANDRRSHALHITAQGGEVLAEAERLVAIHHENCRREFGGSGNCEILVKLLSGFATAQAD